MSEALPPMTETLSAPALPPSTAPAPPASPDYIYAIGRIVPRFPSAGIEKEVLQVMGRTGTDGLTDRQALHDVLSH